MPSFGSAICAASRGSAIQHLLNDYSDVIISGIDEHGGDVLKLIGDGTLAIFRAEDRLHACNAALSAAIAAREGIVELNKHRAAKSKPLTDMYLGLHFGNASMAMSEAESGL